MRKFFAPLFLLLFTCSGYSQTILSNLERSMPEQNNFYKDNGLMDPFIDAVNHAKSELLGFKRVHFFGTNM